MPEHFNNTLTLSERKERFPHAVDDITELSVDQPLWLRQGDRLSEVTLKGFEFRKVGDNTPIPYMVFSDGTGRYASDAGAHPYNGKDWYNGYNMVFTSYADAALSFYPDEGEIEWEEQMAAERKEKVSREKLLDEFMPILEIFGITRQAAEDTMGRIQDFSNDLGVAITDWAEIDNTLLEVYQNASKRGPDLMNNPVEYFNAIRASGGDPFGMKDYQAELLTELGEEPENTPVDAFRDCMEDVADVLEDYQDLDIVLKADLVVCKRDGVEIDQDRLEEFLSDLEDALNQE